MVGDDSILGSKFWRRLVSKFVAMTSIEINTGGETVVTVPGASGRTTVDETWPYVD